MRKGETCKRNLAMSRVPVQFDAGKAMIEFAKLRETIMGLQRGKVRNRAIARLHLYYSTHQLAAMLDIKENQIRQCSYKNKDIAESASMMRNAMISDMSENRVIELLQKMNVDKIEDHRKPQAVKYLMDSIEIAKGQSKPPDKREVETVSELVFRVRQRMKGVQETPKVQDDQDEQGDDAVSEAIDITGEVRDVDNQEKSGKPEGSQVLPARQLPQHDVGVGAG